MTFIRLIAAAPTWMWLTLVCLSAPAVHAADTLSATTNAPFDYAEPRVLTATLYEMGSDRKKILFTFKRTATRVGDTVNVERQFVRPDGSVAAVENARYDGDRLVSFQMKEFQAKVSGAVEIAPDPKKPGQSQLTICYGSGLEPKKGDTQKLQPDTVVDDTVYPYMLMHWDALMQGDSVKFRFVSLEWERTFMFRFVKTGETQMNGRTVEQIKMEPTNYFVARLVDPLIFNVEKDAPHHIVSYIGRTTPRVKKGNSWKYLDAETVFDWK